jgi:hypothetical protein
MLANGERLRRRASYRLCAALGLAPGHRSRVNEILAHRLRILPGRSLLWFHSVSPHRESAPLRGSRLSLVLKEGCSVVAAECLRGGTEQLKLASKIFRRRGDCMVSEQQQQHPQQQG